MLFCLSWLISLPLVFPGSPRYLSTQLSVRPPSASGTTTCISAMEQSRHPQPGRTEPWIGCMLIAIKTLGEEIKASDCFASYRASSLIRFAHISKNSMVWLPGRGTEAMSAPPVESMDEVSDEAKEPSDALAGGAAPGVTGMSAPSTSFLIVVR